MLGDDDGVEVCRQMEGGRRWAGVFVVLISGVRTSPDEQAEGLESLADGYIARPVSNRELVARVEAYVRIQQVQGELARAETYRSLADLALGVSHNFNNLLTSIIGPVALMRRRTADEDLLRDLDHIAAAAERARVLVLHLDRSVNGLASALVEPVDLEEVAREAAASPGKSWAPKGERGLSVEVEAQSTPPVSALRAELLELLDRLLDNACEAMPEGGRITIAVRPEAERAVLEVRDAGVGMDEATRARALEPLFSTKGTVGTGLGLSLVQGAVRRWGGEVEVESAPGEGTTVRIRLSLWGGAR